MIGWSSRDLRSHAYLNLWGLLCLCNVVVDMDVVSKLNADFNDIQAHLDDVFAGHAVVSCAHIAFERILQQQNRHQTTCLSLEVDMHMFDAQWCNAVYLSKPA